MQNISRLQRLEGSITIFAITFDDIAMSSCFKTKHFSTLRFCTWRGVIVKDGSSAAKASKSFKCFREARDLGARNIKQYGSSGWCMRQIVFTWSYTLAWYHKYAWLKPTPSRLALSPGQSHAQPKVQSVPPWLSPSSQNKGWSEQNVLWANSSLQHGQTFASWIFLNQELSIVIHLPCHYTHKHSPMVLAWFVLTLQSRILLRPQELWCSVPDLELGDRHF